AGRVGVPALKPFAKREYLLHPAPVVSIKSTRFGPEKWSCDRTPRGQDGIRDQTDAEKAPYLLGRQVLRPFSTGDVTGDTIGAGRRNPGAGDDYMEGDRRARRAAASGKDKR